MNKTTVVSAGVVVALLLSTLSLVISPTETRVERVIEKIGAVPGDTVTSRTFTVNGVTKYFDSVDYSTGTSTLCVVPRPSATSTILSFTGKNTSATSTAVILLLEKRTIPFAPNPTAATSTTNVIAALRLGAADDAPFVISASTTPTDYGLLDDSILEVSPSQYLVFYAKSGIIPASMGSESKVFNGQCNVIMQETQ